MSEFVDSSVVDTDLAVLFPASGNVDSLKPYASKPKPEIKLDKAPLTPGFSNTIHLKTLGNNLLMEFGFAEAPASKEIQPPNQTGSTVVIDSATAKQLLFALCELFQCDPSPKSK